MLAPAGVVDGVASEDCDGHAGKPQEQLAVVGHSDWRGLADVVAFEVSNDSGKIVKQPLLTTRRTVTTPVFSRLADSNDGRHLSPASTRGSMVNEAPDTRGRAGGAENKSEVLGSV